MTSKQLRDNHNSIEHPDPVFTDNSLRSRMRRLLPGPLREFSSALLRRILGSHWTSIGFRHIDRTPLSTLSKGRFFEPELKLLPFFISKPGFVFDVGANVGEYTYVLEKAVGSENVYGIEPLPQLCARLRALFPKAHILNMALSDTDGTLTLKTPIINGSPLWTRSTLERFVDNGETGALLEEVPVLPLDVLCEQLGVRDVALIKIDVEGHEKSVLLGASTVLQSCHPVLLVEIEQRHHVEPVTELFSWIEALGYHGLFFDSQTMSLRPIDEFSVDHYQQLANFSSGPYVNNFFFTNEVSAKTMVEIVDRAAK
jgi:FkbM family methyltransferase